MIAVVAGAVLLVAGAATALVLLLGGDGGDDDDEPVGLDTTSEPTDEPTDESTEDPADVVRWFVDAPLAGDCAAAEALVTPELLQREGGCDPEDLGGSELEDVEFDVGEAEMAGEAATVPISVVIGGPDSQPPAAEFEIGPVLRDEEWMINEFGGPGAASPSPAS